MDIIISRMTIYFANRELQRSYSKNAELQKFSILLKYKNFICIYISLLLVILLFIRNIQRVNKSFADIVAFNHIVNQDINIKYKK